VPSPSCLVASVTARRTPPARAHGPGRARSGSYSIPRAIARKWRAVRARRAAAVAAALAIAGLALAACHAAGPEVVFHTAAGHPVTVAAEVAATPAARSRGLMYRRELPAGRGMLFLFPASADHAFWMKNTPLPLDIVFIDEARTVVGIRADTVPYSERALGVGRPSRYVLEVPAGFCARAGIAAGDRVEFRGVDPGSGS
jgi:uncharacterized membrane protein (UPF0127 family)